MRIGVMYRDNVTFYDYVAALLPSVDVLNVKSVCKRKIQEKCF